MPQPDGCAVGIYDLMVQCWHENPEERPEVSHVRQALIDALNGGTGSLPSHSRSSSQATEYLDEDEEAYPRRSSFLLPKVSAPQVLTDIVRSSLDMEPLDTPTRRSLPLWGRSVSLDTRLDRAPPSSYPNENPLD
eukprot:m.79282 g.79282  ORF g.79282 m.79282 type:complete len:135 (-) comp7997_c0_seq8:312-716(-)